MNDWVTADKMYSRNQKRLDKTTIISLLMRLPAAAVNLRNQFCKK
jgi:hypothetical protein